MRTEQKGRPSFKNDPLFFSLAVTLRYRRKRDPEDANPC